MLGKVQGTYNMLCGILKVKCVVLIRVHLKRTTSLEKSNTILWNNQLLNQMFMCRTKLPGWKWPDEIIPTHRWTVMERWWGTSSQTINQLLNNWSQKQFCWLCDCSASVDVYAPHLNSKLQLLVNSKLHARLLL